MGTLFIIGLLLAPVHQVDLKTGAAVIQDTGHAVLVPGYHLSYGDLHIGLQLPLRIQLADSKLRPSDLDELEDYGRVLRQIKIGSLVELGPLRNLSDAHHLVLDHFFNRINDDEPRTALILRTQLSGFNYTVFADQVFGPPIIAGLIELNAQSTFSLDASILVDTDSQANPLTNDAQKIFGAGGISIGYRMYRKGALTLAPYLSIAQTHLKGTGGHFGFTTKLSRMWGWQFEMHTEAMAFTQHYIWAPFDLMYLIRKTRNDSNSDGAIGPGWGGRLRLSLTKKHVQFGAQTSAAVNSPQQVNVGWIKFDQKPFSLFGVMYAARHNAQSRVFTSPHISAAVSAQLKLSRSWMIESSVMHTHRVVDSEYQHFLEAALLTNWRISFQ